MWRNHRDPRISEVDAWVPESNHAESRVPGLANVDHIDERLMKSGGEEFFSSPYKGGGLSDFSMQDDELKRELWLRREPQGQSLASSRKLSRSVNGGSNDMGAHHFERTSSGPRSGSFFSQEEDLYSSQEMLPVRKDYHRTQTDVRTHRNVPHLDEELYPVVNTMMNHRSVAPYNQGYTANAFALRKGLDSRRAALEGAMVSYASHYSNPPIQNSQYDGRYPGPSDYHMHSYADYDHLHARFDVRSGQFSGDAAYTYPKSLHQLTAPPLASQREMSLVSTCTCCKEHARILPPLHLHSSYRPNRATEYPPLGYQHPQALAHFQDHISYGKFSSSSSQKSLYNLHLRRKTADPLAQAVLARKQNRPPLPGPHAAPYVLCQGCDKVVQIPSPLLVESAVLKVRCGACRRISKFCNIVHPCYQALVKEGRASSEVDRSDSLNKEKSSSTAGNGGIAEQDSAALAAKLNKEFKSSFVVKGEYDGEDKQIDIKGNGNTDGEQNSNAYTSSMLLEQGRDESEWREANSFRPWSRSGTCHEDSSSLFSASGSVSTKNTTGHKSHDSEQTETHVEFVSECTVLEEGVEAKVPIVAADSTFELSDNRPKAPSKELQGLMLECLQESSYEESIGKKMEGFTPQRSQSHQDKHDEAVCLSNDDSQQTSSLPPNEQTHETLAPKERIECSNLELGHGQAEVSNGGVNSSPSCPSPGSPLYEYLSYDTESEIVKAVKNDAEGKQAVGAPRVQNTSKGSNFLTSFLKKNTPRGNAGQGYNRNLSVVVNGTLLPFDAIKSAEKQAGAIRPGVYWYDYKAGFWGVTGGPCLGIIPPFIAEFKLPLAKNCSGGTTGILVNGRELHKKDLDALAGRGLPRTPGKSYMVDISGQVVDNSSGQMLRSLGRLAPTVQKRGRGCGMFQPPTLS